MSIHSICFLIIILCSLRIEANSESCDCGLTSRPKITPRIFGGSFVKDYKYPWIVSIFFKVEVEDFDIWSPHCAGTLISETMIVSAAHCFENVTIDDIEVLMGTNKLNADASRAKVKELKIHPHFDETMHRNDIAILILAEKINCGDQTRPICLPSKDMEIGENFFAAGWGMTGEDNEFSNNLMHVELKKYPLEQCKADWKTENVDITENQICAGDTNKGVCQGDSGGPLMVKKNKVYYLIGIPSFAKATCAPAQNNVFTNIVAYESWLSEQNN